MSATATAMTTNTTASKTVNQSSGKNKVVTMDRRHDQRRANERKVSATGEPRRKAQRRRHIDPTTCERDYSDAEVEFMKAMDEYKQSSGRMFPTCSEVLEVLGSLGYVRLTEEQFDVLGIVDTDTDDDSVELSDEEADDLLEV